MRGRSRLIILCEEGDLEYEEADMSLVGIICGYPKAYELENKERVEITGIIRIVVDKELGREIPVCRVLELKQCVSPEDEYVSIRMHAAKQFFILYF